MTNTQPVPPDAVAETSRQVASCTSASVGVDPGIYEAAEDAIVDLYIQHSIFDDILNNVTRRIDKNARRKKGQLSILVTGYPNAGKSTLFNKLVQRYPKVPDGRTVTLDDGTRAVCDQVPVIAITCPSKPTELILLKRMLKELGDPFYERRNVSKAHEVLASYMQAAGTIALVVDEAQRPTDRKGKLTQVDIATLFQTVHDQGIVVVLVGLGRAEALLNQDEQVGRRWSSPQRLVEYRWGDPDLDEELVPDSRYQFLGLLKAVTAHMKLKWSADIDITSFTDGFPFYY